MNGSHFTADCYNCSADLSDLKLITDTCERAVKTNGLTIVGNSWVKFPDWNNQPGGVTGALVLAESHLAIHTWPETGNVTIDVYVCNFTTDNSCHAKAALDFVIATLNPEKTIFNTIERGSIR